MRKLAVQLATEAVASPVLNRLLDAKVSHLIWAAGALLAFVVFLDQVISDVSLGVLYVLPMLPAAAAVSRGWILAFALVLACVRFAYVIPLSEADAIVRFLMGLIAYSATGLFVGELVATRRLILRHSQELEEQQKLRRDAETHLKELAESNPAAILTIDSEGKIIVGNRAAGEMLAVAEPELSGLSIAEHLPVLADALRFGSDSPAFRTAAQCQGRRAGGELFVAQTWFSTYTTPFGRRLAAIAVDVSDEVRDREEQNLRQLLVNNRIVAAAVSHEMRNVCGAIQLLHSRLKFDGADPAGQEDFRALSGLVEALARMAAAELQVRSRDAAGQVDVNEVLNQFRIIVEPDWRAAGGSITWRVPKNLPPAVGESYGVLQALMNLSQNSLRAVGESSKRLLAVATSEEKGCVLIQVADSGPGIDQPQQLFTAFHSGATQTGLGLYVSRAILRSYGGDLRFQPAVQGASFVIELPVAARSEFSR